MKTTRIKIRKEDGLTENTRSGMLMMVARASWYFSRKPTSIMQVSRGLPHMLSSNHAGRGQEPVTVQGSKTSLVTVYMRELTPDDRAQSGC